MERCPYGNIHEGAKSLKEHEGRGDASGLEPHVLGLTWNCLSESAGAL
jgi:hypothetical protein